MPTARGEASEDRMVCGLLVMAGLFTVPAAILASGSMAYAYFTVHQPHALLPMQNGGDTAALFCWAFLAIAAVGAGPWSLDAVRRSRRAEPVSEVDGGQPTAVG